MRNSFTLIELMVVIAILVILIGALITVGRTVVVRGKEKETATLLTKLDLANKEFFNKRPLGKMASYIGRYGNYAPDELDGFSSQVRLPFAGGHVSPSKAELFIGGTVANNAALAAMRYSDIKAFALGIRLFSETGTAILDDVSARYRKPADRDAGGQMEYLERSQPANTTFDAGVDQPLDYFVDAWGTPLAYFAVNDARANDRAAPPPGCFSACDMPPRGPANGEGLWATKLMVKLNNEVPFFVSYGADGPDQFSKDFNDPPQSVLEAKDLIWDYASPDDAHDKKDYFDNRFNADNVYSHEGLKEKLAAYRP